MNANAQKYAKYIKFALYALVVVLINLAGVSFFFRADLTTNKTYSLSAISKKVAGTLTEPLTVKVFFTRDLPAPHNTTELYLHDLLSEYAQNNKKYFQVQFYNVSAETEGISETAHSNQQTARDYGIHPVQIQILEQDELKFKQAYMGLVIIHGDIIERIPTITSTEGLEYKLTTAIQKLNHKVSALLALDDKIKVDLVLSSSIYKVAPFMGLQELDQYPERIKEMIGRLNTRNYNKLEFKRIDPSAEAAETERLRTSKLMHLKWPDIAKSNIAAGEGIIGMLLQYKDKTREIPLLHVMRLPIFGEQYQLTALDQLEDLINTNLDRLININEELGYLADYGTLDIGGGNPLGPQDGSLDRLGNLLNKTYTVKAIDLEKDPVPNGLKCLLIARPTEKLSDYALYQIDQALMRGTNLALFVDAFEQKQAQNQPFMANQMPTYVPLDTGLEKLLEHYGVRIKQAIVMDEKSYRQRRSPQQGGGEQPIYFAPIIEKNNITSQLEYLKNIKGLIALEISPLELNDKRVSEQKIEAYKLFSSSERSWEMRDRIILNPMFIQPPAADEMARRPLAYLLEGSFESYFKGQPMPEKPATPQENTAQDQQTDAQTGPDGGRPSGDVSLIRGEGMRREQSAPAKIFVMASSKMIGDQLMDENGQSPNTMFVMNMIDALNGREDVAVMRSKEQSFNPLDPTGPETKNIIKSLNIAGLPIAVILFGLLVWTRRHAHAKKIQRMFEVRKTGDSSNR
ncbi:MAG: ABC transporter permease [Desulfobacteraceae bacterium]|nr:MAG: ABC transporter permease [Desulfobacteraceae bacterium]